MANYLCPFDNNWLTFDCPLDTNNFICTLAPFNKHANTGFQYAIAHYRYLYESTGKTMAIPLSGGVDSQAVVLAAAAAKVPFKIYSLRFNDGLNSHELSTGQQLAEIMQVNITYIDIDIIKFYTSGQYLQYITPYQNSSPQIAAMLWFYELIASDNNIIIGPGNPIIKHAGKYSGMNNYTLFAWERLCKAKDIAMLGFFLWYSTDLFGSLYSEFNENLSEPDLYIKKCEIYHDNGFEVIPLRQKLTGFEMVKDVFFKMYPRTRTPYDTFFRYPHEAANNRDIIVNGL